MVRTMVHAHGELLEDDWFRVRGLALTLYPYPYP
jgi:hypothetical protein